MKSVFVFIYLVVSSFLFAGGPAINDKGIPTSDVVKISLSKSQVKSLSEKRVVVLSSVQMKNLSPAWKKNKIGVVSENWKDCTCGMIYGFWVNFNSIAIPKKYVDNANKLDDFIIPGDEDLTQFHQKRIIMSLEGDYFLNGIKLSNKTLISLHEKENNLVINVPSLTILSKEKRKIFLEKLEKLGLKYFIFG